MLGRRLRRKADVNSAAADHNRQPKCFTKWFPCVLCAFRHVVPAAQVRKEGHRQQPSGEPFWTGKEVEQQINVVPQVVEFNFSQVVSSAPEHVRRAAANAGKRTCRIRILVLQP